jgi:hypothetical protein
VSALPTESIGVLGAAVGRPLLDVERMTATTLADYVEIGGREGYYFVAVSGPVQLTFGGGAVHALYAAPSRFSVLVDDAPLADHWLMDRHHVAEVPAPTWLRAVVGRIVRDVRIYFYKDGVDSDEPRQAAVSYVFDDDEELIYCIYLHGRMSGDELVRAADLLPDTIDRWSSVVEEGG